ncbi:hypothetical protein Ddye_016871 [Dipteronia dyeriana]|uniref:Homeobox domain-containing protein n=1 Tax=Dipteronia dyeriana TaxID=168575 RepID=A0AAD9X0Q3_9ROSI|nr:hypothetical protein Ddye_016871 [Dipteronia dyeriana]
MEAPRENSLEIQIGSSAESFRKFLDSQRDLFHCQINQLQNIVVTQCRLTGVNPLSQEMAAGALSIKIGKRPRDLLNPKAIKHMQAVFSVKDAISKKECREISVQFGGTVTQVKDFFASQRSRVRKFVRLSREKATRSNACEEPHDDRVQNSLDSMIPVDPVPLNCVGPTSVIPTNPVPLNCVGPTCVIPTNPVPLNPIGPTSVIPTNPVPLNSVGPPNVEESPACSAHDDSLVGIDDLDKYFVVNIFNLLRKEETFSGQVKLMEWILKIQNSSVLSWFLTKGGMMILATWLSQAAVEEQTSVLVVMLKVLSHLPLHKALPEHMSAILQSVNKLRFYRASDISNRARTLLSKWSKMLVNSQATKKPNGFKSSTDAQNELILKQSIGEIMADESWQTNSDIPQAIGAPSYGSPENFRKLESPQPLKLLTASADDSAKKSILGVSSSHNRERRKVQLMEQPGQKLAGRSMQAARAAAMNQGRPMSADDIQKAKMRAHHMQSKYEKTSSSNGSNEAKTEALNKSPATPAIILPPVSKVNVPPKIEEQKKLVIPSPEVASGLEVPLDPKQKIDSKERLQEKGNRVQIPWQTPPEVILNDLWGAGAGENSKEIEVQKKRNQRDKETIYHTVQEIPSNPKEPWDREMDYDDTLTVEIPTEQPPDAADSGETQVATNNDIVHTTPAATPIPIPSRISNANPSASEPDLELLAVLLKNPELVFALTSGQAGNLSSEDTVKLLDMIKAAGGSCLSGNCNGLGGNVEEKVEVSLPSPTPASNLGMSGWSQQEVVSNPFSRQNPMGNNASSEIATTSTNLVRSQIPAMNNTIPQQPSFAQQVPLTMRSSLHHQSLSINSPIIHNQASEMHLAMNNNLSAAAGPSMRIDIMQAQERQPVFSSPSLLHTSTRSQGQPQHPHMSDPMHFTPQYTSRPPAGNLGPVSDSWRASQGSASIPRYQANPNNYNASFGGPVQQPLLLSGPSRGRNKYVGNDGFESWSPEHSPTRPSEYMSGRNFQEPGMSCRPDRSRQWNSSGHQDVQDHNKHGNKRWSDRRR